MSFYTVAKDEFSRKWNRKIDMLQSIQDFSYKILMLKSYEKFKISKYPEWLGYYTESTHVRITGGSFSILWFC